MNKKSEKKERKYFYLRPLNKNMLLWFLKQVRVHELLDVMDMDKKYNYSLARFRSFLFGKMLNNETLIPLIIGNLEPGDDDGLFQNLKKVLIDTQKAIMEESLEDIDKRNTRKNSAESSRWTS
uniref:Uncharacterized protein n=1 Tax=Euglena hiemalis TaxID=392896 RepID=A0A345UC62_9EUGL|nr:hypothetical protein [Euglena hiemalis]AXI98048.1 hypothetical protein [Euglena hiemalis]